ncbi:MAG: hypothetical protein OJF50_002554 [Nitrospira sp.]|nr:hypothetical protein [Nitrospira sp.]
MLVPSFAHLIQADKLPSVPTTTGPYENMSLEAEAPPERGMNTSCSCKRDNLFYRGQVVCSGNISSNHAV